MQENKILTEEEKVKIENMEAGALLDRGVEFKVKKRKFIIKKPYLGTLDIISKLNLDMAFEEDVLQSDNITHEANKIANKSAMSYALLIAVVVLNSKWKIKLFAKLLANWFYWNIKPYELKGLAQIILEDNSLVDFILSIRLIAGMKRTTKPNLIEQSKQA